MKSLAEVLMDVLGSTAIKACDLPWTNDLAWQALYDRCESPIERLMCRGIHGYLGYEARVGDYNYRKPVDSDRRAGALVYAQHNIHGDWTLGYRKNIRADFLIVGFVRPEPPVRLIVECDGAAYHDPNADAVRDNYVRAIGYEVVRFTGQEITRQLPDKIGRIPAALGARYGWLIASEYGSAVVSEMTDYLEDRRSTPPFDDEIGDGFCGNWGDTL
jgi:hypothetical protein